MSCELLAEDGTELSYHNLYEQKPATGRCRERPDGLYEHQHVKQLSEPYFSVIAPLWTGWPCMAHLINNSTLHVPVP